MPDQHKFIFENLPSVEFTPYTQELANELRKYYVLSILGNI